MNFLEYQSQGKAPQPVKVSSMTTAEELTLIAAQQTAEQYQSLLENVRGMISSATDGKALFLQVIGAMYGDESEEVAAVQKLCSRPAVENDLMLALLARQRRQLQQQQKVLAEQSAGITKALADLDAKVRDMTINQAGTDAALSAVLTFAATVEDGDMLPRLQGLYDQYKNSPVAMGLLYGIMSDQVRREYVEGKLDLVQKESFYQLRQSVLSSVTR